MKDGLTEEQIAAVEEKVGAVIDQAVEDGLAAPYPDPDGTVATEFRP